MIPPQRRSDQRELGSASAHQTPHRPRSSRSSTRRSTLEPFTDKQIELVETFADQAVIAIENVRLLDEVQARTRELAQSVEELQALGEVSQW